MPSTPDLFSAEICQDPYPAYEFILNHNPVYFQPERNLSVVSGYAEASRVLREAEQFSARCASFEHTLLGNDGNGHSRVRKIVSRGLHPANVPKLRSLIDLQSRTIVDRIAERGRGDFISELAVALPVVVGMQLLGLDESTRAAFVRCSNAIPDLGNVLLPANEREALRGHIEAFRAFLRDRFERLAEHDDLALDFLFDNELGLDERVDIAMLLVAAATQTTTGLIGNAVRLLLRNPSWVMELRRDPHLLSSFVEEVLRFEAPVQRVMRMALRDNEIGGVRVPVGAYLLVILGAANRDPTKFPDPNRFDMRRQPNEHLSFGFGPHRCLGLVLARIEAYSAIAALLEIEGPLALAPGAQVKYRENLVIRCPLRLDAEVHGSIESDARE